MLMQLLLTVFLFHHAAVGEIMLSCRLTFGSNKYDLTRLSDTTLTGDGTSSDHSHYALNPCGLVPPTSCGLPTTPTPGLMACQIRNNSFISALAFIDGTQETNASFTERQEPGSGVVMTISNGDKCLGPPRTMIVTFICDRNVRHPTSIDGEESPKCTFQFQLRAADACPLGSSDDGTLTTFGGGTIFIVLVIVIVSVYLVVGLSWKHFRQGYRGLETIPHREFWRSLPGLVFTGCKFTLSKVCRISSSKYQSV